MTAARDLPRPAGRLPGAATVCAFLAGRSGAASIELALGAVVLITVASLSFDLYTRVGADTASARMAVTMAAYVSLDPAPSVTQMEKLAEFLNAHELGVPADLVYAVTAIHKPAGNPVAVLWGGPHLLHFGSATVTNELAERCPRFVDRSTPPVPVLPSHLSMLEDGVLIATEVCVRLKREGSLSGRILAGDVYRFHILPARTRGKIPAKPA